MARIVRWSDQNAILGGVSPAASAGTTGTSYSTHVNAEQWHRVVFLIHAGAIADTGTINVHIEDGSAAAATGSGTTGWNSGTAKLGAITTLTTADDGKQVVVEVDTANLAARDTVKLRAKVIQATAASVCSMEIVGTNGRFQPASEHDIANVDEIVYL